MDKYTSLAANYHFQPIAVEMLDPINESASNYGRPMAPQQAIIFLPGGFYLLSSFFFPCLIAAVGDWISTILPWCGLSENLTLRCRSETSCTRLAENTGRKKIAKNSPSAHHRTTLSGHIFPTKARIDNRKKVVKQ